MQDSGKNLSVEAVGLNKPRWVKGSAGVKSKKIETKKTERADADKISDDEHKRFENERERQSLLDKVLYEARHEQKFEDLVSSDDVLLKIHCLFPFDFFPDEITIDVNKVNIIRKQFLSKKVQSIFIRDIIDLYIHEGIIFASISITEVSGGREPIVVNYLLKKDAERARRIIQGLLISLKKDVDLSKVQISGEKIEAIGKARGFE